MNGPYLIGVDVGTTAVKAALFDLDGHAVETYSSPFPTDRPAPGLVEQNPRDWIARVLAALAALVGAAPRGSIAGLGLCSQVNTHVFVDARGEALMPAIVWQDGRCAENARELDPLVPLADRLRWWGAPLPIDASHVLSRIAWVRRARPDVWLRTRWVMAPKDYCLLRLTGEAATDPLSAFGIVDQSLNTIPDLIALQDGAAERLPPLNGVAARLGRIRDGLPGAGLPVVTAAMDAWTGMIGAGAVENRDAVYLGGTSEVGGIVSHARRPTPGVIAFPECEGIMLHAGPTQSGGASVAWLAGVLGRDADEISVLARASDPAKPAPVFLPHLQGERAPLWDIAARGVFAGLDASMGAPEMARAVLEGVAYSVRWLLGALEQSSGVATERLFHAGGGARSDVWCQIRADVLDRAIDRRATLDSGVLGAAMLAGVGAGLFSSVAEAGRRLARSERVFEPDPTRRAHYDEGFARYRDLYVRLVGFRHG
jgi:xylulokinase